MYTMGDETPVGQQFLIAQWDLIDHIQTYMPQLKEDPSPDSEVAFLDTHFADAPVPFLTSLPAALVTAMHSLAEIKVRVEAGDARIIVVRSLLRAALLGSCRATYCLSPETREERIRNTGMVLRYDGEQLVGAMRDFSRFEHLPVLVPPGDVLTDQEARLEGLSRSKTTETSLIKDFAVQAGEAAARRDPQIPAGVLEENLTWIWRTNSAAVHGLGWLAKVPDGQFLADLASVAAAANMAVQLAAEAWVGPLKNSE